MILFFIIQTNRASEWQSNFHRSFVIQKLGDIKNVFLHCWREVREGNAHVKSFLAHGGTYSICPLTSCFVSIHFVLNYMRRKWNFQMNFRGPSLPQGEIKIAQQRFIRKNMLKFTLSGLVSPSFLVKILCYTRRPFTSTLASSAIICAGRTSGHFWHPYFTYKSKRSSISINEDNYWKILILDMSSPIIAMIKWTFLEVELQNPQIILSA